MLKKLVASGLILLTLGIHHIATHTTERTIRSRVVQLKGEKKGSCSGVQVRSPAGKDYILTAGHCEALKEADNTILVRTDDSRFTPRKILEVSPNTDLMLLEGIPGLKGLQTASSYKIGQNLRTFTHGSGLDTYKTEGELIQEKVVDILVDLVATPEDEAACTALPKNKVVILQTFFGDLKACAMHLNMYISTAKVVPGSSGGGIFDSNGDVVAIVSAGDGTFGIFVTLADIHQFLATY